MSGQDIELRFEVENSENVKIVEDVFHIYKYENDLTNEEILQRKNQFKELTGKTPLFFEFTQPEEMSVTELTIKGSSLQIKFDENIHSENYFSDMFSSILGISKPDALLRYVDSSTGSVLFLGKLTDNKLEWLELTEPLKEYKIFIIGEIEYENDLLKHLGAICLPELDNSCNLIVIGENPDLITVEKTRKTQIEVISESEIVEKIEGWQAKITISEDHAEWLRQAAIQNQESINQSETDETQTNLDEAYQYLDNLQKQLKNPLWRLWFSLKGLIKSSKNV